jgi:hypothetical protein
MQGRAAPRRRLIKKGREKKLKSSADSSPHPFGPLAAPAAGKRCFPTGLDGKSRERSVDFHACPCYLASAGNNQTTINLSTILLSQSGVGRSSHARADLPQFTVLTYRDVNLLHFTGFYPLHK